MTSFTKRVVEECRSHPAWPDEMSEGYHLAALKIGIPAVCLNLADDIEAMPTSRGSGSAEDFKRAVLAMLGELA
jgi:hypothetical protein